MEGQRLIRAYRCTRLLASTQWHALFLFSTAFIIIEYQFSSKDLACLRLLTYILAFFRFPATSFIIFNIRFVLVVYIQHAQFSMRWACRPRGLSALQLDRTDKTWTSEKHIINMTKHAAFRKHEHSKTHTTQPHTEMRCKCTQWQWRETKMCFLSETWCMFYILCELRFQRISLMFISYKHPAILSLSMLSRVRLQPSRLSLRSSLAKLTSCWLFAHINKIK